MSEGIETGNGSRTPPSMRRRRVSEVLEEQFQAADTLMVVLSNYLGEERNAIQHPETLKNLVQLMRASSQTAAMIARLER